VKQVPGEGILQWVGGSELRNGIGEGHLSKLNALFREDFRSQTFQVDLKFGRAV
jgi:hypothetical protein